MAQKTIQERAVENTLDDIRILDEFSGVTNETVLYPSETRLASDLAELGYDMPDEGMYTVEAFLDRVGTTREAGLQMSLEALAALLMDLVAQAVQCDEINATTRQALITRFAQHIDEQA